MYRISLVSYSNTLPFKEALYNSDFILERSVLQERNPAMCASDLFNGNADIALVPVGAFPLPEGFKVIGEFCLAAYNKVESVLLFSQCPLNEIKTILLDYQSRSSVKYVRILAEKFWNLKCDFVDATESFEFQISGNTAAVIIGDRALNLRNSFQYKYDLASEWFKFTGKPAVFAVWVAKDNVDADFLVEFNSVLKAGVDSRVETAQKYKHLYQGFDLQDYLTNCLDYKMDSDKLQSIDLFENWTVRIE